MKLSRTVWCPVLFLLPHASPARAYEWWERQLEPGPHSVGFRSLVAEDTSRNYSPPESKEAAPRPVQISLWYPSRAGAEAGRMPFSSYFFLDDRIRPLGAWPKAELEAKLEERVRAATQQGAEERHVRLIFGSPTRAILEAPPARGPFPFLLFSPSMLASAQTNTAMCEYLASHGYVVAAHPSFGPAPSWMTTDVHDLETQARDLEFMLDWLIRVESEADASRIGLFGHSWGAMASLLAAARNPRIGAVVSLDGSEEMWRDVLESHPAFSATSFVTPYLRVAKPPSANEPDTGLFDSMSYAPSMRLILDASVAHFEVVSSGLTAFRLRAAPELGEKERVFALVSRAVRAFFDTHLRGDTAAGRFLESEAGLRAISPQLISVEKREGTEAPPDDTTFLRLVAEQGWEAALPLYRHWVSKDARTFSAERMVRIGERLLWTGQHNDSAIAILQLASERFPESARAREMLGNVYYWNLGQAENAQGHYLEALRLNPGNLRVRIYLEQISGRPR